MRLPPYRDSAKSGFHNLNLMSFECHVNRIVLLAVTGRARPSRLKLNREHSRKKLVKGNRTSIRIFVRVIVFIDERDTSNEYQLRELGNVDKSGSKNFFLSRKTATLRQRERLPQ